MIPAGITKKVLSIGPDYKNHRGGIGALIDVYKDQYEIFNFIPSYQYNNSNAVKAAFFLKQLVRICYFLSINRDVKLLHIHSAKSGSLYRKLIIACLAKIIFRKKVVNHIHTGHFRHFYEESGWLSRKFIRFYLKMNDATITVSDFWKTYFIESFHLRNVYKLNNIVPYVDSRNTAVTQGPILFLFLGIITKSKGIFDLVSTIAENRNILEGEIKLIIGGSGQEDVLVDMIKKNKLESCVEFKGWVTGEEKERLLKHTHVFVLPSYFEGVPISILEAMRYGKPIISSQVGGIPEIVETNVNGLLITPGEPKALLDALLFYINDRQNIDRHGTQSLLKVKNHYPDAVTRQLERIYAGLTN